MKYDVIVIGGGPAGIISAVTAKMSYPEKSILVINDVEKGVIPCGIPYMFTTLDKPEDNALGTDMLKKNDIDVEINEVTAIERKNKIISTKNNKSYEYDKLILATGSKAIIPPIKGIEKKGIYFIKKRMDYLKNLKEDILNSKNIIIVGGGFIGVEFADELIKSRAKVTIIEFMPRLLAASFDKEFSEPVRDSLTKSGVNIITDTKVIGFNGDERVKSALLTNNQEITADLVIFGIGAKPNSDLARNAGLEIGSENGINVNEYLKTSDPDIFSVGDCAEKRDFFTRKKINVMLASTATAEARIAGTNLFNLKLVKENKGTIGVYSTKIGDLVIGSAGLTEEMAQKEGFDILIGNAESTDKHPGTLPNTNKIKLKLIFSKLCGTILGGQASGGDSVGELINIIGLAIQKNMSFGELETLQIATHPKLTPAPTMYPLIIAAQDVLKQKERKG